MKKKITLLIIILFALSFLPAQSQAKLATLINADGDKAIVEVGSQGAQYYFGHHYVLMTSVGSFAPSTGYRSKLTSSVTSSATTIYVSSIKDINGYDLPCTATNKCYFNIEPGASHQEPVVCTGASNNSFTGCTRGLPASGSSETGSTTVAYTHNAGSIIIMTNIAQFYGNFMDLYSNQTVDGVKAFNSLPTSTTTTPTDNGQLATKKYVDDTASFGAPSASETVNGISELSTSAEAAAGTSAGGTGARLVLPGSLASSTPAGTQAVIPVTGSNGKLSPNFLNGTESYTFNGTTTLATTSFNVFPTTPNSYPTASTSVSNKGYVDTYFIGAAASDNLKASADTAQNTTSATYVILKSIQIPFTGTYRTSFAMKAGDVNTCYGIIYRNGVSFGTQRSVTGTSYATSTEDLIFFAGDTIDLYAEKGNSTTANVINFRIYYDLAPLQAASFTPRVVTN